MDKNFEDKIDRDIQDYFLKHVYKLVLQMTKEELVEFVWKFWFASY